MRDAAVAYDAAVRLADSGDVERAITALGALDDRLVALLNTVPTGLPGSMVVNQGVGTCAEAVSLLAQELRGTKAISDQARLNHQRCVDGLDFLVNG